MIWCIHGYDKENTCPYCSPKELNSRVERLYDQLGKANARIKELEAELAKHRSKK
jgi:hypothetical protein